MFQELSIFSITLNVSPICNISKIIASSPLWPIAQLIVEFGKINNLGSSKNSYKRRVYESV